MTQNPNLGAGGATAQRILKWLGLIALIVFLGLTVRFAVGGLVGDFLGGVLYTVLVAVLVFPLITAILRRRMPRSERALRKSCWVAAAVALAVSVGIELLQLSSIPARLSEIFPPARLVLGTSFAPFDLVAYCVGALLVGAVGALAASAAARAKAKLSATTLSTNSSSAESRGP